MTPPDYKPSALAAARLMKFLRANAGSNSDWPVEIRCDMESEADELAGLLKKLEEELRGVGLLRRMKK